MWFQISKGSLELQGIEELAAKVDTSKISIRWSSLDSNRVKLFITMKDMKTEESNT